jgi:hypothetical protein
MTTFQNRQIASCQAAPIARRALRPELIPEAEAAQSGQNSPAVLQSYVTYDTLQGDTDLKTTPV